MCDNHREYFFFIKIVIFCKDFSSPGKLNFYIEMSRENLKKKSEELKEP